MEWTRCLRCSGPMYLHQDEYNDRYWYCLWCAERIDPNGAPRMVRRYAGPKRPRGRPPGPRPA